MFKDFVLKHLIDAYLIHIILLIFPAVYFVQVNRFEMIRWNDRNDEKYVLIYNMYEGWKFLLEKSSNRVGQFSDPLFRIRQHVKSVNILHINNV